MASIFAPLTLSIPSLIPRKREIAVVLAENCLRDCVYYELRNIHCELRDDTTLVLYGTVSSFYLKQIAQTLVGKIPGVQGVDNQLEVIGDAEVARQFDVAIE